MEEQISRFQKQIWTFLLLCLMWGANAAHAAVTVFNDRTAWQAAAGTSQTIDFSTDDNGAPLTNPPSFTFSSGWSFKGVTFLSVYSYYDSAFFSFATSPIHVDLPANTTAFGVDLKPFENVSGTYTVKLSTGAVFTIAASQIPDIWDFFGVISTTPIQWMEVTLDSTGLLMDNFSFVTSVPIQNINIDVKPSQTNDINPVNPDSNGVTPVAILSSATFDATQIDPATVRFGHAGTEAPIYTYAFQDVNGDNRLDMVIQFKTQLTGIKCGDTVAKLTGKTQVGQQFAGSDAIKTVGCN